MPTLAEDADQVRRKIVSGQLVLSIGEWQTVIAALDLVGGASEKARDNEILSLMKRIRK